MTLTMASLSPLQPPHGHVDGGARATTCDHQDYLWGYHAYTPEELQSVPYLKVADATLHQPVGYGYLKFSLSSLPNF